MDSPYSPLPAEDRRISSRSPVAVSHDRHAREASHTPPLVPLPHPVRSTSHYSPGPSDSRTSYDPDIGHRHASSSTVSAAYSADPYHHRDPYRNAYATGSGGEGGYREGWRDHDGRYSHFQPPSNYPPLPSGYDPYYQHQHYHQYQQQHAPRGDPYGSYSRDQYYHYSSRDPYYPPPPLSASRGPPYVPNPHPHPHSHPPPAHFHPQAHMIPPSSAAPLPLENAKSHAGPPSALVTPSFPLSSTAVSLGPHPTYGHLDPASDLTIPILYLVRPISTKTFVPLRNRFRDKLELRFVNSLLDLERDLSIARNQDLRKRHQDEDERLPQDSSGGGGGGHLDTKHSQEGRTESEKPRRRIWVTAVGGTDALVQKVYQQTQERLEWKEIKDLQHLQLELMWEEKRVEELWQEDEQGQERKGEDLGGVHAEREEGEECEEGEDMEERLRQHRREGEDDRFAHENDDRPREWGVDRRGIESSLEGQHFLPPGKGEELDRVLRAVRGEKDPDAQAPSREYEHAYRPGREGNVEPDRLATSRNGERGEAVVDRFENMVKREHVDDHYSSGHARPYGDFHDRGEEEPSAPKRSRQEENLGDVQQDHSASRAARKKLEAVCKAPRRSCVRWAEENDVPVNDETRMVDDEPVLGERHRGVWNLFGQDLDDLSPQIQVLMARAMRDVTYPLRLRLYSNPQAQEQLEQAVPWFTTILKTIEDRYELAGAASVVPQDPPVSNDPLDSGANNDDRQA